MEKFSPELRLLLALLRATFGASGSSPVDRPHIAVDWKVFLALVERHRVGAFLHQRGGAPLRASCPEFVLTRLKAMAGATAQQSLIHAAEQIRLMRALDAAGVEVMAVKGLVLAHWLYGGPGIRHVGDIDLFVRTEDAVRADAVLQASGLQRFRPDFPLTPLQTKKYLRLKPEFEYRRGAPPMRVELLWRLEGLRDLAAAWAGAVPHTIGGFSLRTLPRDLDVLYLLQHGARHGWFRLFWLVDAALLLRDPQIDWKQTIAEARRLGVERPVLQAATLAESLLGLYRPAALQPMPREQRIVAALAAEASRQIACETAEHAGFEEWARQLAYRVRLQKHARAKLEVLAPHVFSPESWRMWRLPDRWFFLYHFAAPFLWLWRRLRRDSGSQSR